MTNKYSLFGRIFTTGLVIIIGALNSIGFAAAPPPVASFTYTWPGLTVQFTDTSVDPDGSIVAWNWDFGDESSSDLQHPLHTYSEPGTYIVQLIVTDNDADTALAVNFVVVQNAPGGSFGNFTEVTPFDSVFLTPQNEDFWTVATAPADYDNDGDLDIAVIGYYVVYNVSVVERLLLMRNDGPVNDSWVFTYFMVDAGEIYAGSSDMVWGDLDGDGDLDLVVGSEGETILFRNDNGTLIKMDVALPGYYEDNSQAYYDLNSITLADYDNDGDLDLLIPSVFNFDLYEYETAFMRNDSIDAFGNFIFTRVDIGIPATEHAQSIWADADNDQDLDLLLVNIDPFMDNSFIRLYYNNGDGTFTAEEILGSLAIAHGEAQWGDYDNDGDLDILVAGNLREADGNYTPVNLRIYRNNGTWYDTVNIIPCTTCDWFDVYAASWADYDSDGDMDILLAGSYNSGSQIEGRARILINDNGTFIQQSEDLPAPHASGSRGGSFTWLDMDNDGDLDYFIAGEYFVPGGNGLIEAQMHLYRNDSPLVNQPPVVPQGLTATPRPNNGTLISWQPSADDHTPMASITYDLELFRDNLPVSLPSRLPKPGNLSATNEWLLENLPIGHYKYTIRAVDASFTGSELATGQFSIGTTINTDNNNAVTKLIADTYPNPVTSDVTFRFQLPVASDIEINLYEINGKRLSTLHASKYGSGQHTYTHNISNLKPGLYFYKITAGNKVATGKIAKPD